MSNALFFHRHSYTFENVFYQVIKRRIPKFSHECLTKMWSSNHTRWMVLEYMTKRVVGTLEILEKVDLIGRTAELAKLFGIQFLGTSLRRSDDANHVRRQCGGHHQLELETSWIGLDSSSSISVFRRGVFQRG